MYYLYLTLGALLIFYVVTRVLKSIIKGVLTALFIVFAGTYLIEKYELGVSLAELMKELS